MYQHGRPTHVQQGRPRLHYRLLTLCPAPLSVADVKIDASKLTRVSYTQGRGTGSVGDSVGEGVSASELTRQRQLQAASLQPSAA